MGQSSLSSLFADPNMDGFYWDWWLAHSGEPPDPDVGCQVHLARLYAEHAHPTQWRALADDLYTPLGRIWQTKGGLSAHEARERGATLAIIAINRAAEEFEVTLAVARAAQGVVDLARAPRENGQKQNGIRVATPERFRAVAHRVVQTLSEPAIGVVATPFPLLNWKLDGGFRPGELIYLGGRPGTGKSTLASEFALCIAQTLAATLFVSAEMTTEAVARRMVAQQGRLDASTLRTGHGVDHAALAATVARMYDWPIWLTHAPRTVEEIAASIDAVQEPIALVVVDYLQLLQATSRMKDRRLEVEQISQRLKALALQRGVPLLVLSSLSRPAAGKPVAPTMVALRESGSLEHDADIVLLLHRVKDATETECIIDKNRDGRTGTVDLLFNATSVRFEQVTHERED